MSAQRIQAVTRESIDKFTKEIMRPEIANLQLKHLLGDKIAAGDYPTQLAGLTKSELMSLVVAREGKMKSGSK